MMAIGLASEDGSFLNTGPYLELNSYIIYRVGIGTIKYSWKKLQELMAQQT